jgi:transcriptional regulator with XRE-family HTH domain
MELLKVIKKEEDRKKGIGVNNWCILRSNGRVKAAIKFRMKERGIGYKEVAKIADVRANRVSSYLNNHHEGGRPTLTQKQIMKICIELNIEVTLSVKFE